MTQGSFAQQKVVWAEILFIPKEREAEVAEIWT
jgi:hypothetical protein